MAAVKTSTRMKLLPIKTTKRYVLVFFIFQQSIRGKKIWLSVHPRNLGSDNHPSLHPLLHVCCCEMSKAYTISV